MTNYTCNVMNCMQCDSNTTCMSCYSGYELTSNGTCQPF